MGAAIFVLGSIQFVRPNVVFPGAIFYGGGAVVAQLWSLLPGIGMWRRANVGVAEARPVGDG